MPDPVDPELRAHVLRLLRGDVRERDLDRLFYRMREESGDSGIVAEVALPRSPQSTN